MTYVKVVTQNTLLAMCGNTLTKSSVSRQGMQTLVAVVGVWEEEQE